MKKILKIVAIIFLVIIFVAVWDFYKIYSTAKIDMAEKADAIAVLSAAQYAGKPSPVYKARLDKAIELFKLEMAPAIITTGGVSSGGEISEGAVGKKYLISNGIPANNIISDEKSLTTNENIKEIAFIALDNNFKKIIVVSDPFHMYRAMLIAKEFNLDLIPSPTRNSPVTKNSMLEYKYMARETAGVMLQQLHFLF